MIEVGSLDELAAHATESGNEIRMRPGTYEIRDFVSLADAREMHEAEEWIFLELSGDDNEFDFSGVTWEFDTELREALDAPVHTPEFALSGDDNVLTGLTITNVGDGASNAENVLDVLGDGNVLRDVTLHVRGSFPYGYGDLLGGAGGGNVVSPEKHCGLRVAGDRTQLLDCEVYMRAYGHGFYVQGEARNTYFKGCYVEGEMRTTDEMLAETEGVAYELDFETVRENREGEYKMVPGYMKSLAEDGFRTYSATGVTFVDCVAKNMRGGWELRSSGPIRLENCTAVENERNFWVGSDAVITNSRGDARYGPLLFVEGEGSTVDVELLPYTSDINVHALATVHGADHDVTIRPWNGIDRDDDVPVKLAYQEPLHGEVLTPFSDAGADRVAITNQTAMSVDVNDGARECRVRSRGDVRGALDGNNVEDL